MSTTQVPRALKFTYEDYRTLPEDKRYELLEGELLVVPAPGFEHQRVLGNLLELLRRYVREQRLGVVVFAPIDV